MRVLLLAFLLVMIPGWSGAAEADQLMIMHQDNHVKTVDKRNYAFSFFINEMKLNKLMDELEDQVYKKPKDAVLDAQGDIVSAKPGLRLDRESFSLGFRKAVYKGKTNLTIPVRRIYPRVDSELLSELKEQKIGNYTTTFRTDNKERTHNIRLAAEAINNKVVFPGEVFSFNRVVGKRTEEKGYKRAPVIVKGELAEDIGGGICQTSSTLYNAVDLEGIEIIERYSHSRRVPYVPPGRDATVSWWGPDFSFKNKLHQPILIRAKAENGAMKISIYSSAQTDEY